MSEDTNTAVVTSPAKPKAKRERATQVAFSSIHVRTAKARNVDVTRAAKLNRTFIRTNFDSLVPLWPELKKSGKDNRDGNRYPTTIPAKVADMIVARNVPKVTKRASK